jgi:hypothetical protein
LLFIPETEFASKRGFIQRSKKIGKFAHGSKT